MNFLKREESVTDEQLNSAGQMKMASLVKSMGDEELSMAWRSQLNAKLAEANKAKSKQRYSRRIFAWGSTLSLGAAAGVFGLMFMNTSHVAKPQIQPDSTTLASELVKTHQESMVLASVSGTGAAARETSIDQDAENYQEDLL